MHLESLSISLDNELMIEMSESLLRLTRISSKSKCQEKWGQASQHKFIEPQINRAIGSLVGLDRGHRTLRCEPSDMDLPVPNA